MGLNIHVHDLSGPERYGTTQQEWWDVMRHEGDADFYLCEATEWEWKSFDDEWYKRPMDFGALRAWIRENIFEGNQPRLLEALDRMEENPSLWFQGVW